MEMRNAVKVLALDPGGTTGWAMAELGPLELVRRTLCVGQIKGACEPERAWKMMELIAEHAPDVVVIEDFRLFPDRDHSPKLDGTEPMRLIAMIDFMWWMIKYEDSRFGEHDIGDALPKLVKQMPGERTGVTDAMLKDWGLWRTEKRQGGGPHAMDALRHLIVYIKKVRGRG